MNKNLFLIVPVLMISFAVHASVSDVDLPPEAKTCIRNLIIQTYQEEWKNLPAEFFVNYTETIRLTALEENLYKVLLEEQSEQGSCGNSQPSKREARKIKIKRTATLQRTIPNNNKVILYSLEVTPEQLKMIYSCPGMRPRSMKTPE